MDKTENSATNSTSSRLTENEAKISFLIKDVEDLSQIVAKQGFELEKLIKKIFIEPNKNPFYHKLYDLIPCLLSLKLGFHFSTTVYS